MWFKRLTHFLLKHPQLAMLFTFLAAFPPLLGVVSILFAGMMTLLKGPLIGGMYTVLASVPYVCMFYYDSKVTVVNMGLAVLNNGLTWLLASAWRREGAKLSALLQVSALIGVLIVSVVHLVNPDIANWWAKILTEQWKNMPALQTNLSSVSGTVASTDVVAERISAIKEMATGYAVVAILLAAVIQTIIAKWWLATVFKPGSLKAELHYLRLTPLAGVLFLLAMIFSYWGNPLIFDIIPILYLLFLGFGLSLIHYLFGLIQKPTRIFCLLVFYTVFLYTSQFSILVIALLAFMDIWLNFRRRVQLT